MRRLGAVTAGVWLAAAVALGVQAQPAPGGVVAAYYAGGAPEKLTAQTTAKLTHIIYAFVPVCGDTTERKPSVAGPAARPGAPDPCAGLAPGSLIMPDTEAARRDLAQLASLKAARPELTIIASVGGWGMGEYPAIVRDPQRRRAFASSAAALLSTHRHFDGIDIDWEYPGGGDEARPLLTGDEREVERRGHAALVHEVRVALDVAGAAQGRPLLLTCAVAGYPRAVDAIDWPAVQQAFDLIFVMTYDFTPERSFQRLGDYSGAGGPPGHHTNLFATPASGGMGGDAMIMALAEAGAPLSKTAMGVGFYGREWTRVSWDGPVGGTGGDGRFVGAPSWRELKGRGLAAKGYRQGWDPQAGASYLAQSRGGGFISLDDPRSIRAKGEWARRHGLAGLFAWQLGQDDGTLVDAMGAAVAAVAQR
jgi:chitinase